MTIPKTLEISKAEITEVEFQAGFYPNAKRYKYVLASETVDKAVKIISDWGQIDGAHHKMWVLDMALRALLGPEAYEEFVKDYEEDGEYHWDKGRAP